jgi:GAF domain-containing protein
VNNSFSLENDDGTGDTGDEQIKIPYGVGIAGHVASTQQSLNIEDAYADSRFNPKIDQKTGYKTKSILCLPILNENGECIAVAEAINKIGDLYGSDDDAKDKFEKCEPISFSNEDEEVTFQYIRECRCLKVILD